MTDKKVELNTQKTAQKSQKKILTEREKLQKRREYMRKYYQKKKNQRIAGGKVINPSRSASKKGVNNGFSIKRGTFVLKFE